MRITSVMLIAGIMFCFSGVLTAQNRPSPGQKDKKDRVERDGQSEKRAGKRSMRSDRQSRMNPGRIFQHFDANEDGVLTVDEVPQRLQQRLVEMDTDQDDAVSKREFMAGIMSRMKESGGRPGRRGKDSAGRGMSAEMIMKRVDKNGDGRLSLEEAPDRMKEKFERIDASGDGYVDQQELASLVERMKGKEKKGRYDTDPEKTRGQLPKRPPRGN